MKTEKEDTRSNEWMGLHAVTKTWRSDLDFIEDEINFFRLLIDKHLLNLIEQKNVEETRAVVSHLVCLEDDRRALLSKLTAHSEMLASLMNDSSSGLEPLLTQHKLLEKYFVDFERAYRQVKKEVFRMTERIVHAEKAKKLIDWA